MRARLHTDQLVSVVALMAASLCAAPAIAQTASSSTASDRTSDPVTLEPRAGKDPTVQAGASGASNVAPGEIVVTAQKRVERLVEVPIAVTAISGDALASQQINDSQSLSRTIPSLSFQQGGAPNNSSFRIRGVGTALFGQGVEPSVSVVVDGVVAPRASSGFADLLDVERVEVLRGPQGTLFGKNATAGVINVVTARPSSTFGGNFEATIAEREEYRVKGTVTGPISDTLRGRLSAYYNNIGGYLYNLKTDSHEGGSESYGARGKLEWEATPNLNVLLTGEYRKGEANCCVTPFVNVATPALATLLAPLVVNSRNRRVNNDDVSFVNTKIKVASLQADWDIGPATITSITAYQGYNELNQAEPDNIVSDPVIRFPGAGVPYAAWNFQPARQSQKNYSQELRIGSNGSNDLTYVFGIFLNQLDLHRNLVRRRQTCSAGVVGQPCAGTITNQSGGFDAQFDSKNAAIFGQIDWRVIGGLHILAGIRGQYEKQKVTGSQFGPVMAGDALFPGTNPNSGTSERDDTAVTGKAGLRYEFTRNLQTYVSYTRGYKAFALDLGATTRFDNNPGLNPEHVNAYELGLKFRTYDGAFDINAALFRSDYTNLQTQTQIELAPGTFQVQQINAGKSRSQGIELESTIRPSEDFSLAAAFSYTDATIDINGLQCALQQQAAAPILTSGFPINSCYRVRAGTTVSPALIDLRGGRLPVAPKFRVTLSPRYEAEIGTSFRVFVQSNLSFQSSSLFALNQDPLLAQEAYTLVDVSAGFGDADRRYTLTLFVRNIFNTNYYTNLAHNGQFGTAATPFDLSAAYAKDSRRYGGATASLRF